MAWLICLLLSCMILKDVTGSDILFNSTPKRVSPLLSSNLTMSCKIVDTAPTGKRSVQSDYDFINNVVETARREEEPNGDVTRSDGLGDPSDIDVQNMTKRSVSHTDDNVHSVSSIIISRNGVDLVSISTHFGVRQLVNDVIVTGQLTGVQGERGELQITWPHPTPAEAGEYSCDITTFSAQARSIVFSQTLNIEEVEISMSDLVNEVYRLKVEKEKMEKTLTPNVLFSAINTQDRVLSQNQSLIFDKILTSEGHGYDNNTGVYTAPLQGFYMFHVHITSDSSKTFNFALQHNGNTVIKLTKGGDEFLATRSDSVILKLNKEDQVRVVSAVSSSYVEGDYNYYKYQAQTATTFTGRLVSL